MSYNLDKKSPPILGFRADPEHRKRLFELAEAIGSTPSEVLRQLVENAELVEEMRFVPRSKIFQKCTTDFARD